MGRVLAAVGIVLLFVLNLALPYTSLGRRGTDTQLHFDVPGVRGEVGQLLPTFTLLDLEGSPVSVSDFRGKRVLLTFERSIDW